MGQVVTSGQTTPVSSGSTVDQTDVESGGALYVLAGGTAYQTTIEGGGFVSDLGTVSGVTALNGDLDIQSGGVASNVFFSRGYISIESGGVLVGGTESGTIDANDDGGFLSVQSVGVGATTIGTLLDQGGLEFVAGQAINTVASGRTNIIVDTGVVTYSGTNATVSAHFAGDGLINITGVNTQVAISNIDEPGFFGPFTGTAVIGAGTSLSLEETNALDSGTILFHHGGQGGTLILGGNVSPTETIGDFYSGNTIIVTGGVDSAAQVGDDIVELFYANGTEDDITILGARTGGIGLFPGNGEVVISSYLEPTVVDFGSSFDVDDPEANYLVQQGGSVTVGDGGTLDAGSVGGDGDSDDDDSAAAIKGGALNASALKAGTSDDGGNATSALLTIQANGSATDTLVTSGGVEDVQSGGTAYNDTFLGGSEAMVESGAASYDPNFKGGALIDDGAVSYGMLDSSPASASIYALSGSGTVAEGGNTLILEGDASSFAGQIVLSGGTVEIAAGANIQDTASVSFVANQDPVLQIDAGLNSLPQAVISGFSTATDSIDLRGVNYSANTGSTSYSAYEQAAVTSGGVLLAVTSGGTYGTLDLDAASTGSGPLNLVADGQGGTDITFSTLSAGTAGQLGFQLFEGADLADGTFTIFLTSAITLTQQDGGIGNLQPVAALNGATVVLDGEGFSITAGPGGATVLSAGYGPVVVTSLGGGIGLDVIHGGHVAVTSNTFGGGILLTSGTLEVVDSGGPGTGGITFDSTGSSAELLQIDAAAFPADGGVFGNVINDFATLSQQYIDLAGLTFSSGQTSATLTGGGHLLTVTNGAQIETFTLLGAGVTGGLNTFDDSNGGTFVTADAMACYLRGTLILTEAGERPVETLAIGERVVTASGAVRPIRWIGHRAYQGRFLKARRDAMPICIRAGALADQVPRRDLYVSPSHAMFIDGMLVPAASLVNGSSITQVRTLDEVSYWHVELATHDVLLAEGAPSETYVDDDSRGLFHNVAEWDAMNPGRERTPATYCARRVESGYALEAVRQRLVARGHAGQARANFA